MKMYTVHDKAAHAFLPPFTVPSERDAKNSFELAAKDPNTNISKFPADFTLLQIAEWDEREGKLTTLPEKLIIVNAAVYATQGTNNV